MRMRSLSPLLLAASLGAAFWLGRLSSPVKSDVRSAGLPGDSSVADHAGTGTGVKSPGADEATAAIAGASLGFDAASSLDPSATISSLLAMVANEPPGLSRLALLHAALQRITA